MRKPKVPIPGTMAYTTMVQKVEAEEKALEKQKAEEMAQKAAERDAEHRFQIKLVFLTVATTLFVEHFGEILDLIKELFQVLRTFLSG